MRDSKLPAIQICQEIALGFGAQLQEIPSCPDEFRARFKARSTLALKNTLFNVGKRLGMTTEFDSVVRFCKPPQLSCEYDFVWIRNGQLYLAAESEWLYQTRHMASDFRKLLYAATQLKLFLFRRNSEVVLPVLARELEAYSHHVEAERYICIEATDYKGNLIAHEFRVPATDGRLNADQICFEPVPGTPFGWMPNGAPASELSFATPAEPATARRQLDRNRLAISEDWHGTSAAFTCPICTRVFVVDCSFDRDGRKCPTCGKSVGSITGAPGSGGTAEISWPQSGDG